MVLVVSNLLEGTQSKQFVFWREGGLLKNCGFWGGIELSRYTNVTGKSRFLRSARTEAEEIYTMDFSIKGVPMEHKCELVHFCIQVQVLEITKLNSTFSRFNRAMKSPFEELGWTLHMDMVSWHGVVDWRELCCATVEARGLHTCADEGVGWKGGGWCLQSPEKGTLPYPSFLARCLWRLQWVLRQVWSEYEFAPLK